VSAFFICAPGRARGAQAPSNQLWWLIGDLEVQVLYGPWWWEPLAGRQGCPGRPGIWRKPQAKPRPDEQESHTRQAQPGEKANIFKAQ